MSHEAKGIATPMAEEAFAPALNNSAQAPAQNRPCYPLCYPIATLSEHERTPKAPQLELRHAIKKGPGGLPRILSLAAERVGAWYSHPKQCPPLQSRPDRQTRSERRQALQIVLHCVLARLDLATMALGTPTLASGFIDVAMRTMVQDTGLKKRRIERAIA